MDTKMNVDDIKISGMTCASCAKAVERAVKTVNGEERYTLFKERLQGRCDG